jgi:hypothetical protein
MTSLWWWLSAQKVFSFKNQKLNGIWNAQKMLVIKNALIKNYDELMMRMDAMQFQRDELPQNC